MWWVGVEKQKALQPVINLHSLRVKMLRVCIYKNWVCALNEKYIIILSFQLAVAYEVLWKDSKVIFQQNDTVSRVWQQWTVDFEEHF